MAEGAPLLREYGVYSLIEGSNPSLSAIRGQVLFGADLEIGTVGCGIRCRHAPVAQLDRVPDYESGGRRFESSRARHLYITAVLVLLTCIVYAPVAQLDRVPDYESGGRRFESSRARQIPTRPRLRAGFLFLLASRRTELLSGRDRLSTLLVRVFFCARHGPWHLDWRWSREQGKLGGS